MRAAVDPVVSLSMHSLLPMVSFIDHIDHVAPSTSKVVDDGEAPDSNQPEMGRRGSRVTDGEVYKDNWFWCGVVRQWWRRTGGMGGWRDGLANGGVALHSEAC